MKPSLRSLLIALAFIFGSVPQLRSQGYVVPNGVTQVPYGNVYSFHVRQNPINSDYTGFSLIPQGTDSFAIAFFLDEGVRVFFVSANQPVALQPILSQAYPEYLGTADFTNGNPFYVGLYTGYSPWDSQGNYTGIYTNPMFGWAQLVNNGGVIQLLNSALACQTDGIYAGTTTLIPEPHVSSLIALSLLVWISGKYRQGARKQLGRASTKDKE